MQNAGEIQKLEQQNITWKAIAVEKGQLVQHASPFKAGKLRVLEYIYPKGETWDVCEVPAITLKILGTDLKILFNIFLNFRTCKAESEAAESKLLRKNMQIITEMKLQSFLWTEAEKEATHHLVYDQWNRAADQRNSAFRTVLALADTGIRIFFKLKTLLPF